MRWGISVHALWDDMCGGGYPFTPYGMAPPSHWVDVPRQGPRPGAGKGEVMDGEWERQEHIKEIIRLRARLHRAEVECEAWRTRRFFWTKDFKRVGINRPNPNGPGFIGYFQSEHEDIDAAVDALMAEEVTR